MIQFNLLPDVKLEYIRAERTRRLIFGLSIVITLVAIGLLVLLLSAGALERKHLSDLDKDINRKTSQLKSKPQINKILTVQNQLQSLTALHDTKPAVSRTTSFLNQITPNNVTISSLQIDYTTQTITITGGSDALSSVNKYVDTIKYTTFTEDGQQGTTKPFTNVVLTSFGLGSGAGSQQANYVVTASYNKDIFDITKKISLTVPSLTTTRAAIDQQSLFQQAPTTKKAGN